MTGLYIALAALAVLGFVMLMPVTAAISFALDSDENEITVRYLFLKFRVFPSKPKEKKEKKEKKPKKEKKKDGGDTVKMLWSARAEVKWGISKLLYYIISRAITVKTLNISARFGFEDPMYTGLLTGAANGYIYNIIGVLDRHARLVDRNVELCPDFDGQCAEAGVYCRLRTRIAHIFQLAVIILITLIKIKIKTKNGGKKNEQSN